MSTYLKQVSLALCAGALLFSAPDSWAVNKDPPKTKKTADDIRNEFEKKNCPPGSHAECVLVAENTYRCACVGG